MGISYLSITYVFSVTGLQYQRINSSYGYSTNESPSTLQNKKKPKKSTLHKVCIKTLYTFMK